MSRIERLGLHVLEVQGREALAREAYGLGETLDAVRVDAVFGGDPQRRAGVAPQIQEPGTGRSRVVLSHQCDVAVRSESGPARRPHRRPIAASVRGGSRERPAASRSTRPRPASGSVPGCAPCRRPRRCRSDSRPGCGTRSSARGLRRADTVAAPGGEETRGGAPPSDGRRSDAPAGSAAAAARPCRAARRASRAAAPRPPSASSARDS